MTEGQKVNLCEIFDATVSRYKEGQVSFSRLVRRLDEISWAAQDANEVWSQSFFEEWTILEQVNADLLDGGKLTPRDAVGIAECLERMASLVR